MRKLRKIVAISPWTCSRRRLAGAMALAAAAAILASCGNGQAANGRTGKPAGPAPPVPVLAATVSKKDVPVQLKAVGAVEARQTVAVKALVGGQLIEVHFQEGQNVTKGDLLFKIDDRPYAAALKKEEANLSRDIADAQYAERESARYADLSKKNAAALADYDRLRSVKEVKAAQVLADKAAVESARLQVEYCTIRSPLDGRTGSLGIHAGNLIKANDTEALVTIVQIAPIGVAFFVPEDRLALIQGRMKESGALRVEAVIPGDDPAPVAGELTYLDNQVDRATGSIRLRADFSNEDQSLWPGQFVDVALTLSTLKDALLVPSQAVRTGQKGTYVLVVKSDQSVETRSVTAGAAIGAETVVATGVAEGETVVTDGHLRITPNSRVQIKKSLDE